MQIKMPLLYAVDVKKNRHHFSDKNSYRERVSGYSHDIVVIELRPDLIWSGPTVLASIETSKPLQKCQSKSIK